METHLIVQQTINDLAEETGELQQDDGLVVFTIENGHIHTVQYPSRADHFFILLMTRGELNIKLDLIDHPLTKNHWIIVAPHAVRQFISISKDAALTGIAFTPDFLVQTGVFKKHSDTFDFFSSYSMSPSPLNSNEAGMLLDLLRLLHQKNDMRHHNPFGLEIAQYHFSAFLLEITALHRKYNALTKVNHTRKEELLMRFHKMLPLHFRKERQVQFYASQLFITPRYLTQTVKELTGKTAGEIIDEMVIIEAKALLSDPSLTIAQVADSLYFSDQFFFSKFFRNHVGQSPTEYRKSF